MQASSISALVRRGSALVVLVAALSGCPQKPPPTMFPVAGRVTFEGQPIGGGTVTFYAQHSNGGGLIAADGTYTVNGDGLRPGLYYVAITPPDPLMGPQLPGAPRPERPQHPEIPEKYRTPIGSGFQAQVEAKDNHFDFAMVEQPAEPAVPDSAPVSALHDDVPQSVSPSPEEAGSISTPPSQGIDAPPASAADPALDPADADSN